MALILTKGTKVKIKGIACNKYETGRYSSYYFSKKGWYSEWALACRLKECIHFTANDGEYAYVRLERYGFTFSTLYRVVCVDELGVIGKTFEDLKEARKEFKRRAIELIDNVEARALIGEWNKESLYD